MAYSKTTWEDLPSTNTPINATRLNNIESGIEDNDKRLNGTSVAGDMVVNSIRTKNMFDKNSMVYSNHVYLPLDTNSTQIRNYGGTGTYILLIKLEETKTYTISKRAGGRFRAGFTNTSTPVFDTNNVITLRLPNNDTGTSMTFTVPTGSPYFVCNFFSADQTADANIGYENMLNSIQIEEGTTATTYSPYQNLTGEEHYSTEEIIIGKWINGKTLYRKVITTTLPNGSSDILIDTDIQAVWLEIGYFNSPSGNTNRYFTIPFINDSAKRVLGWGLSTGYFHLVNEISTYNGANCYLSLLYTKTTD